MPENICTACGTPFTATRSSRRTCSDACRQRLKRSVTGRTPHQGNPVDANLTPGQIETAVATQLFEAGVTGSPTTALALTLARRIDRGIDTGSAIAACSRELRSVLDELQAAAPTFDIVDELRARYAARRSAAQGLQPPSRAGLDESAHNPA